ncbi:polysaccharide pyruvyl transferase family protein [Glaciecola petra]|uniref:Polysaccharide pyruvyl transferase family protein n=1 Tax=Glaciecola petra TaxID=3075602 RepID=A0ABU2ZM19_9ALTE|nr:polysaccharide pyruvyl transferase family protein [Aestuariibacter sp. P117]MDT0593667.1 polysaccharide pyruvyl transferase family protein [Aestuariibacter sp. P117]
MSENYNIFIPELVPLENKGEEAIVRGIADVLFPDGNCEIHLFDEIEEYRFEDGIHVYPVKWFISPWLNREFGLGVSYEKLRDSSYSILRNGLHKIYPNWVAKHCSALVKTNKILNQIHSGKAPSGEKEIRLKQLLDCDYIVAGHDGALDDRVCHVIDVFMNYGKKFGVFGVEFPLTFKSPAIINVLYSTLAKADFFYCRTEASHNVVNQNFPNIKSETLADPAFGMKPVDSSVLNQIIGRNNLDEFFSKPVVMCTSCEPPPISRYCFEDIKTPDLKLSAHRDLYAELIKHIAERHDVNILFLPHAIGPGKALDDRIIANDILKRSGLSEDRARLLKDLLSGKELKALIGSAEFLVAERIHSMIGSVGVNTPFFVMGSKTDRRIKGIVCDMLQLQDNVYYLNNPSKDECIEHFEDVWSRKEDIQGRLQNTFHKMKDNLENKAKLMRKFIKH